ncbi:hypothetical protein BIW11_03301 [Tropilaelaps mercedesae]|uniref:Secreted protein n=1 Tax=Tropilaelaps mercedesae TaxID=418985 RepID=A0A1V9XNW0_9ACAR|nr:hypothetical protein BIW11_03301 [Tropilaelaps mercedesae]
MMVTLLRLVELVRCAVATSERHFVELEVFVVRRNTETVLVRVLTPGEAAEMAETVFHYTSLLRTRTPHATRPIAVFVVRLLASCVWAEGAREKLPELF